jgi:hypothetical protein
VTSATRSSTLATRSSTPPYRRRQAHRPQFPSLRYRWYSRSSGVAEAIRASSVSLRESLLPLSTLIWRHFSVCVQTLEKCFYAIEYLKKSVLIHANVLSCLVIVCITTNRTKVLREHTERTENDRINMRVDLGQVYVQEHTEPTPSLSVGSSHCRVIMRHIYRGEVEN